MRRQLLSAAALIAALAGAAKAQVLADTGWTYQGKLSDNGSPATGDYDMRFSLFADDQGTLSVGTPINLSAVAVADGLFTSRLDFGTVFNGSQRWLQIEISPAGAGTYTALPLQEITSSPQANFSLAPWATGATGAISFLGAGGVGIGTAAPIADIHISKPVSVRSMIETTGGTNAYTVTTYKNGNGSWETGTSRGFNGDNFLINRVGAPNIAMEITPTGLVSIGAFSAPSGKLHVYDANSVTSVVQTGGGTNSWAKTTYRNGNGDWDVGTSRSFNGDAFYIYRAGAATIALQVLPTGLTVVRTLQITGGSDLAEPFNVNADAHAPKVEPGMVVVIDENKPGELCLTTAPYDTKVAGIISGANGLAPGMVMKSDEADYTMGKHPVAMTGRVWCYVDSSFGAIKPGDRLTTSSTPGHAMKAGDQARSGGAVIGKAMTELTEGKGLVLVLVNLQ